MKNLLLLLAVVSIISACNSSGAGDKKAKLDSLKKEHQALTDEIKKLEEEIRKEGGGVTNERTMLVAVAEAKPQPFTHYIELQGTVDAEDNVNVTPQMPGVIQQIYVKVGQQVSRGHVMAALDGSTINAQLETVKKNWELANTLYEKQKALWEQHIGTEVQYLTAKNQKESLEKQMASLNEQYELTKLISPINGIVDAVDIKIGQVASPGYSGIRVVNFSNLTVKGQVSETYSALVNQGDKVKIYFPDLNKEIESAVSYASKVINAESRSFTVEAKLTGKDNYKPNMIAMMKIQDYENPAAFMFPVNLIQKSSESDFIYVAVEENGRKIAKRQPVSVGRIYGGQAEIITGINAGDKVITVGYQDLVSGQAIQF